MKNAPVGWHCSENKDSPKPSNRPTFPLRMSFLQNGFPAKKSFFWWLELGILRQFRWTTFSSQVTSLPAWVRQKKRLCSVWTVQHTPSSLFKNTSWKVMSWTIVRLFPLWLNDLSANTNTLIHRQPKHVFVVSSPFLSVNFDLFTSTHFGCLWSLFVRFLFSCKLFMLNCPPPRENFSFRVIAFQETWASSPFLSVLGSEAKMERIDLEAPFGMDRDPHEAFVFQAFEPKLVSDFSLRLCPLRL